MAAISGGMIALMLAPTVLSLAGSVFSMVRGSKLRKQSMAMMKEQKLQDQQLSRQMIAQFQQQNMGGMYAMNNSYMMPMGMGGQMGQYGMAPQGYFPPGMHMRY